MLFGRKFLGLDHKYVGTCGNMQMDVHTNRLNVRSVKLHFMLVLLKVGPCSSFVLYGDKGMRKNCDFSVVSNEECHLKMNGHYNCSPGANRNLRHEKLVMRCTISVLALLHACIFTIIHLQ